MISHLRQPAVRNIGPMPILVVHDLAKSKVLHRPSSTRKHIQPVAKTTHTICHITNWTIWMKLLIIAIICAHQSIVLSCQPIGVAICCNMIVIAIGNGHLQREISLQLQTAVLFVQKNKDLISCCAKSAKRIGRRIFFPSIIMSYP